MGWLNREHHHIRMTSRIGPYQKPRKTSIVQFLIIMLLVFCITLLSMCGDGWSRVLRFQSVSYIRVHSMHEQAHTPGLFVFPFITIRQCYKWSTFAKVCFHCNRAHWIHIDMIDWVLPFDLLLLLAWLNGPHPLD